MFTSGLIAAVDSNCALGHFARLMPHKILKRYANYDYRQSARRGRHLARDGHPPEGLHAEAGARHARMQRKAFGRVSAPVHLADQRGVPPGRSGHPRRLSGRGIQGRFALQR